MNKIRRIAHENSANLIPRGAISGADLYLEISLFFRELITAIYNIPIICLLSTKIGYLCNIFQNNYHIFLAYVVYRTKLFIVLPDNFI